jgi:molybdate transport system ATP-binding protein
MISVALGLHRGEFRLDVDFETPARRVALFGESGAGKTTVLDAIAGLVAPDSGRVTVSGRILLDTAAGIDLPPRDRTVGYVRQLPDLFPAMTAGQNIAFARARRGRGATPAGDAERTLGVDHLLGRRPDELSAGETRRVQIARTLASRPALLLLDEPFSNLDAPARREILPVLAALPDAFAIPAVLVTHDVGEVFAFAEEVIVLEAGRIVARGEPLATLSRPGSWPVARVSGVENFLSARIVGADEREGGTLALWDGTLLHCPVLAGAAGDRVTLALFAEDVLLARGSVEGLSARNVLPMRVDSIADEGDAVLVTLAAGARRLRSRITRGARSGLSIEAGADVTAVFKSSALRLVDSREL